MLQKKDATKKDATKKNATKIYAMKEDAKQNRTKWNRTEGLICMFSIPIAKVAEQMFHLFIKCFTFSSNVLLIQGGSDAAWTPCPNAEAYNRYNWHTTTMFPITKSFEAHPRPMACKCHF